MLEFIGVGVVIILVALALDQFDFSFFESGQEVRSMGGPVKDNGYGASERVADNPLLEFVKKGFARMKKKSNGKD